MYSFQNSAVSFASAFWAFFRLLETSPSIVWLTGTGVLILIGAIAYRRHARERGKSAAVKIAGLNIRSLSDANLRRRVNKNLRMQVVENTAVIEGPDLTITWKCVGYCRAGREPSIEFSIDSDNNIPFNELQCFAYDLLHDPQRRYPIRPLLVGPDGISKKVSVPFLAPIEAGQPFSVWLTCELPGCMKADVDYYTASLSFEHDDALQYAVRLLFIGSHPRWLRVYETGRDILEPVKELRQVRANDDTVEYVDAERLSPAKAVRIYVFERSAPAARDSAACEVSATNSN